MNPFQLNKTINRLNKMIENAICDETTEDEFDETKMSALETKLNRYVLMNRVKSKQLEDEKQRISELISDISHQTKTPIANLMLYSGILEEQSELSQYSRQLLKEIIKQNEKLNFLVGTLIKSSRLENGIININPAENSLDELVSDAIKQIETSAENKQISIIYTDTGFRCNFDYKWTSEALYNILDNAVKYTSEGGEINVSIESYEMFYKISVADNGIGIEEAEQSKIFSRFYRSKYVVDKEGVGIGLYFTREIIERQGGYLKVNSSLGKGATFCIFLSK
ncbi:HAMP domain-containing sensor histidine kinase [Tissierella sp. MB52-C2]|uniref:sensor histidine kinase n=1 Tax=Tissierella sp. MB52-C2 TaxID=3070999 RepID=UPI00280B56EE|nr:HAMP domain-containing sensor histidine kinase [Tissierella sp. MB52-C2]WMM26081.1 HAMP domain-containing sensor histidine kinase [Tissierella sp. MB52-C2]